MSADRATRLRFWGVRGGIPTPDRKNLGFGGNTSCVEIRTREGLRLILDAGSGIRALGSVMCQEASGPARQAHIFLSHFHWDHIQGLPFFQPLYSPDWGVNIYSSRPVAEVESALASQMSAPHFPEGATVRADRRFVQADSSGVELGDVLVQPFALNHPGGSTGFRITTATASIVFATDHEHGEPDADKRFRESARNADVLVYDAQYTPEEYDRRKGWGHSSWQEGACMAKSAGVKQLILFHHDPDHSDKNVSQIVEAAREIFANTVAAREGWEIDV